MQSETPRPDPYLDDAELDQLRAGYNGAIMVSATRQALYKAHPAGLPYVDGILDASFGDGSMSPIDRERVLIALLALHRDPVTLGIHMYWGMMEGLSYDDVAAVLQLAGAYHGVPVYAGGLLVLRKLVATLKAILHEGGEALSAPRVLGRLVEG